MPPIICIIGRKKTGKTLFMEQLIRELDARGYHAGAVKHHPHPLDADREGTDTWRHARAGANPVLLACADGFALFQSTPREVPLEELAQRFFPGADLVLAEGFKRERAPKIEVYAARCGEPPLSLSGTDCVALVSDDPVNVPIPVHKTNEAGAVADLIVMRYLKK